MWDLVVYRLVPGEGLMHVIKIGRFDDIGICLELYGHVIQEITKADLIGTYIPMCSRVLQ